MIPRDPLPELFGILQSTVAGAKSAMAAARFEIDTLAGLLQLFTGPVKCSCVACLRDAVEAKLGKPIAEAAVEQFGSEIVSEAKRLGERLKQRKAKGV